MTVTLFNPSATDYGRSADNVLLQMRSTGAKLALVRDSGKLAAMCASPEVGMRVVFRAAGDDPQGDPVGKNDPTGFINARVNAAPQATWIHGTNEVGFTPALDVYTRALARAAEARGKRIVAYNAATNQPLEQWRAAEQTIRWLSERGHIIGVHLYLDGNPEHDAGGYAPLDWLKSIGAPVFVTEYAYIRSIHDANVGYRAVMDAEQYMRWHDAHAAKMATYGYPLFHFSLTHWNDDAQGRREGFGTEDRPEIDAHFAVLNARYPIVEGTPVQNGIPMTVSAPAGLKLRTTPNGDPVLYVMPFGTRVTGYPATAQRVGAYDWVQVDDDGTRGWAAQVYLTAETTPTPQPAFRLRNPVGCAHIISSKFGVPRDYDGDGVLDDIHEGLDITRAHGDCTPLILNGADGVVMDVSTVGNYGNHVKVSSVVGGQEFIVWYCHMAQMFVVKGQQVKAGTPLGVMGSTGNSTGLHLHLNVQKVGAPTPVGSPVASVVDPFPLIDF